MKQSPHKGFLESLELRKGERKILSIDGPAGSGKTTLANEVASYAVDHGFSVEIIHMDDLYNGWDRALGEDLTKTLQKIVKSFLSGVSEEISYRKFDWHENQFKEEVSITCPQLLILEGVGSGQQSIRNFIDYSIWIEVAPDIAFERVLARDGEALRPYMEKWIPRQEEHFLREGTKSAADYRTVGAP